MHHALLIENDEDTIAQLVHLADQAGISVQNCKTFAEAHRYVSQQKPDLAVVSVDVPHWEEQGETLVEHLRKAGDCEIIIMAQTPSLDLAVDVHTQQIRDFLPKPLPMERMRAHFQRLAERREPPRSSCPCSDDTDATGAASDTQHAAHDQQAGFGPMLGTSPPMRRLYDMISRVAVTEATVLIIGESGTGKELVAQQIHERSNRRDKPFVALNCGAVSPNLIESELFGHEKGAFTGASRPRKGVFEQADGGTLFLDEITEMHADLQVKLLRVLETKRFERVGAEQTLDVNVRVLAATNRDPDEAIADGTFREDLLYRLSVFPIRVAPLRQRGEDIELLARQYLAQLNSEYGTKKTFNSEVVEQFRSYPWPGNVRQLHNTVHRAYIVADDTIEWAGLAPVTPSEESAGGQLRVSVGTSVAEMERRLIYATLRHYKGDKKQAAHTLGISLKTLYNRINAYRGDLDATEKEEEVEAFA